MVLRHIRFISDFKKAERILVDFEDLVLLLGDRMEGFGPTLILTLDEVFDVTDKQNIPRGVVEDAILSGGRKITMFSGGKEGASSLNVSGKNYYSVRFNEGCFK